MIMMGMTRDGTTITTPKDNNDEPTDHRTTGTATLMMTRPRMKERTMMMSTTEEKGPRDNISWAFLLICFFFLIFFINKLF